MSSLACALPSQTQALPQDHEGAKASETDLVLMSPTHSDLEDVRFPTTSFLLLLSVLLQTHLLLLRAEPKGRLQGHLHLADPKSSIVSSSLLSWQPRSFSHSVTDIGHSPNQILCDIYNH